MLSHEPPAFRRVIGSSPCAYAEAHQTREMLVKKLEYCPVNSLWVDKRNRGIPRCRLGHDDAFFNHCRCLSGAHSAGSPRLRASDGDAKVLDRGTWWQVCFVEELRHDVRYRDPSLRMWRRCSVRLVECELCEFVTDRADLVAVSLPFRLPS